MNKFAIVCDGACDLNDAYIKEKNITRIPFYVSYDSEHYFKEAEEIAVRDMYDKMVANPEVQPKTSMPGVQDYVDAISPYIKEGIPVLCITYTSKMSGSLQSALSARDVIEDEYENAHLVVMDSAQATVTEGLFINQAVKLMEAGYTLEEAEKKLLSVRDTGRIFFTVGNLSYLQRGGRIGKAAALAGGLLNLKPMIIFKEGEIFSGGITRSRQKSMAKTIELLNSHVKESGLDLDDYEFSIGFGYDPEEGEKLKDMLQKYLTDNGSKALVKIYQIGATIAVHTGPYAIGFGMIKAVL